MARKKRDGRKPRRPAAPTRLELRLAEAEALLGEGPSPTPWSCSPNSTAPTRRTRG